MAALTAVLRYGTFPLFAFGINALLIGLVGAHAPYWQPLLVLLPAIGLMFAIERLIPWQPSWNLAHGDARRDLLHALVNTAFNHLGVLLLPLLAGLGVWRGLWPQGWPFWAQALLAILVADLGISAVHHLSHKWPPLWRFHAVHHSVRRLYGFNGLMKHPLHQLAETLGGVLPLLLFGIPQPVALALVFCVAVQLLLQHSNADYRSGWLRVLFANAEVHRFHHSNRAGEGDVNFGLFTTCWDHLAGTFHDEAGAAPRAAGAVGLSGGEAWPDAYLAQLVRPFR
ncbi:MAG TPA: sterol desaturase family protein [Nevskia sp.]|nr:sterol desaturase family protein [Nevskia sp.]